MGDSERAITYIRDHAEAYAKAKAERVYIEQFRKSKKSLLMRENVSLPVSAQERDAYAHPAYVQILEALKVAIFEEEKLKLMIKAAEMRFESWRTESANERKEKARYGV